MKKIIFLILLLLPGCNSIPFKTEHYGNNYTYIEIEAKVKICYTPNLKMIVLAKDGQKWLIDCDTIRRMK